MQPFRRLSSPAITVMEDNVDTDVIFPARFLLRMDKAGLGECLFHDRRVSAAGEVEPHSPFDRHDRAGAAILIAGDNFGCGSSREHAVWALADFGIRCVIAPGFGEIFYANCFNSGVLPVTLDAETVADLAARATTGAVFDVDLEAGRITHPGGATPFTLDAGRREALLRGWDAIDLILEQEAPNIARFETAHATAQPWLFEEGAATTP